MPNRVISALIGLVGVVAFAALRPGSPTTGSDCEVLSTGFLREPVAALSSVLIVVAGWVIARHRIAPGAALLLTGAASVAAHATAHPMARALDGIVAATAVIVVVWSLVSDPPDRIRLGAGIGIGSIGVAVWLLTRTDAALCDAVGPWGHATWHLLVAAAAAIALTPPRTRPYA
jgi:hypothetical protein